MRDRSAGRSARGSRLPLVLVALALAGAAAIAGVAATREATAQGWFPDGLWRLALARSTFSGGASIPSRVRGWPSSWRRS